MQVVLCKAPHDVQTQNERGDLIKWPQVVVDASRNCTLPTCRVPLSPSPLGRAQAGRCHRVANIMECRTGGSIQSEGENLYHFGRFEDSCEKCSLRHIIGATKF